MHHEAHAPRSRYRCALAQLLFASASAAQEPAPQDPVVPPGASRPPTLQEISERLMAPWQARIAERMRMSPRDAATVARMVVAASRAVLELWCAGVLTREQAVHDTARGVSALLEAFSGNGTGRTRRIRSRGA